MPWSRTAILATAFAAVVLATAMTFLAGAGAGVPTGNSGWYYGNPPLGPSVLTDLSCAGTICYAAGGSTALKSTDGGATWSRLVTGLRGGMERVGLVGGSADSLVVSGRCAAGRSDDGGRSFTRLAFAASETDCPWELSALSFPSPAVGYLALGSGAVLSTADRGRTFSAKPPVPGGTPRDLLCTTDTTCFAVTSGGTVQVTTDGASSWTQVASVPNTALRRLHRAEASTFYAVGDNLAILRSEDGGATWARMAVTGAASGNLISISCSGARTCLLVTATGAVLRTDDGGRSLTPLTPTSHPTRAVAFAGSVRAVRVGASGAQISNDAGQTWAAFANLGGNFLSLEAASALVAYAGGQGGVLARTADAGRTWGPVNIPTGWDVYSIAAPSEETVVVVSEGNDGLSELHRSDNGGRSARVLTTAPRFVTDIVALDGDRILVAAEGGMSRSTNGGETFERLHDRVSAAAGIRRFDLAGSAVVAFGKRTAIVSTDGGQTWKALRLPGSIDLADFDSALDFVSARVGFLADSRGRLWRTGTRGRTWSEVRSTGRRICCVAFADARRGYAFRRPDVQAEPEPVLRTTDGGRTWHPQFPGMIETIAIATGGGTDYALGGSDNTNDTLVATTTGGEAGAPRSLSIAAKPKKLAKAGRVTVSGVLQPAAGGETVVVAMRRGLRWTQRNARVAANGAFRATWRVSRTAVFVAQIPGSSEWAGAGTPALTVTVGTPSKRRR